ncbi:DUF1616 domain-containing protein [Microbacteriaceae bacterium K1510]|nr:DUF1616 domain-containing protein [Microbacteriaceae bacterium K1510]
MGPAIFATVCAVVGVTMFDSPVVRTIAGLPLVFYLPGHAILCAVGRPRRSPLDVAVFTVGLSIAVTVFCGLALNMLGPLTPLRWAVALTAITLGAFWRAHRSARDHRPLPTIPLRLPALSQKRALMLAASIAIAVVATTWSRFDALAYREFAFTELWMVPETGGSAVTIGIRNAERAPASYDLELVMDNHLISVRRGIDLKVGEKWLSEFAWPVRDGKAHAAEARLFKRGQENVVYRRVWLRREPEGPRT